ncbi:hypothetical protein FP2506_10251 [Fulvimarina pelagi HTCC2506]|uniref:Uncharacterized protein n=1 Tax=Fulvimarina pelagi HTCC2506 TaxID=314231 RepID=Q0G546_9HYPH|nr:DUF6492 family protein [Fulvimarina pelagi]EAU43218.1 hypothetical protein FP2506_10251 [Fulvimarina pelagi HTCC2506]
MSQAIVTSSYRGDFERCRLLCDSIDARVRGHTRHILAVESRDVSMFRVLEGPKREVVDERDLFPWWLRAFPDPTRLGKRRIWLTPVGLPLRGWHTQQLRRIMLGAKLEETALITVDSDVVFLRDFETGNFEDEKGRVAFYRKPGGVRTALAEYQKVHYDWSRKAGEFLGIPEPKVTDTGYIGTLIAWNTASVRDMSARIESVTGHSAIDALARTRLISECTIYGRFVDEIENRPDRHYPVSFERCRMYWAGDAMTEPVLRRFIASLEAHHVAAGIQSFTGTDSALLRRVAGLN